MKKTNTKEKAHIENKSDTGWCQVWYEMSKCRVDDGTCQVLILGQSTHQQVNKDIYPRRLCNTPTSPHRWRRSVVVSGVRHMNEVNARRARLVPGLVTVFGRVYHLSM